MSRRDKKRTRTKKSKLGKIILMLLIVALIAGSAFAYKVLNKPVPEEQVPEKTEEPVIKKINIFNGDERPIAVMIDNNVNAWPHSGIDKAYVVYEIIVEGGETRLMAIFKGQKIDMIGPIRSSRHYFLDYALENDAMYVHFGWSPQAKAQISNLRCE